MSSEGRRVRIRVTRTRIRASRQPVGGGLHKVLFGLRLPVAPLDALGEKDYSPK